MITFLILRNQKPNEFIRKLDTEDSNIMRILIDIGHPGHVHLFRPFAERMIKSGNEILFTCREKEAETSLLKAYGFQYIVFGKHYNGVFGKLIGLVKYDIKMLKTALKFKPNVFLSHGSVYAAHAAFFLSKINIAMEDTGNKEQVVLYKPFTKYILTPSVFPNMYGKKQIKYNGYHELAYLHPKRFTPDKTILRELCIKENEKYVILRFVSWNASHDFGHTGISLENKIKVVQEFSKYAKVFISAEGELPIELKKYKISIAPHRMHDAIAYSSLLYGESSTMAEEAAMLGVPSVYLFNKGTIYTKHLENEYDIMYNFSESEEDQLKSIEKGLEILLMEGINEDWQKKRVKMLSEKIDVTAFLVWFIENYPKSVNVMKENPDYQYNFK